MSREDNEASKSWTDAKELSVTLGQLGMAFTDNIATQMLAHAFVIQALIYAADMPDSQRKEAVDQLMSIAGRSIARTKAKVEREDKLQ
jgi:hypothetical protein